MRQWGPISALHGMQVRDSLRQVFERRGGARFRWPIVPDYASGGTRNSTEQWCIDGAVASLITMREDRRPFEWVGLLVNPGPKRNCSAAPDVTALVPDKSLAFQRRPPLAAPPSAQSGPVPP
jgi:hypothetical protein